MSNERLQLFTDASGKGFGAVFKNLWFFGEWNKQWASQNITVQELYPIVLAVETWGMCMQNKSICFHTDNEALVHILNKMTSKDKNIMYLIRRLVLVALNYNILFSSQHIQGKLNIASDALSRLQIDKFLQLVPEAEQIPASIPLLPKLPV